MKLTLRQASTDDAPFLFAVRNDPVVRAASWTTAPLDYADHCDYLQALLDRYDREVYILAADGTACGYARLKFRGRTAEVEVNLAEGWRGKRLGPRFIEQMVQQAQRAGAKEVVARIKGTNIRSIKAYLAAGFVMWSDAEVTMVRR